MSDHKMIKVEYTGNGEFYRGIPARDLTDEEFETLDKDARTLLKESPVYKVLSKPKKVSTASEAKQPAGDDNKEGD